MTRVPGQDRTFLATWTCSWKWTSKYEVCWRYWLSNGKYVDSYSSVSHVANYNQYQATYQYPENATAVQVWIRPHEATDGEHWGFKVNGKWVGYLCPWSPKSVGSTYQAVNDYLTPKDIPTPSIEIDKYRITVEVGTDSIEYDKNTTHVQFYIVDENGTIIYQPLVLVNRSSASASFAFNGAAGKKYKVSARGYNQSGGLYGKWSSYSSEVSTPPAGTSISSVKALSTTSVRLTWPAAKTAKTYEVQYTYVPSDFQKESGGSSESFTGTSGDITGLETGHSWYFRVRAVNDSGESGWSASKSVLLGIRPDPPTTWSSVATAQIGDKLTLNWTHNTRDGSGMTNSQVEINIGGKISTYNVAGKKDADTQEWLNTGHYDLNTSNIVDGSTVRWRVRTKGVLDSYSDWSVTREVKVYAPATLTVVPYKSSTSALDDPYLSIDSFPFYIVATAGPVTQKAIGFHITITANSAYQKTDYNGERVWVNEGEEVYSHYFDFDGNQAKTEFGDYAVVSNNVLTLKLMPYDVDFENGQTYTIKGTVAMNTGLTAENSNVIDINWTDQDLYPSADVQVDKDELVATIIPFCPIIPSGGPNAMVELDEEQEEGEDEGTNLVPNVLLSVWRIDYDGRMTKILDEIPNDMSSAVVDPHPAINYARYRVVAVDQTTGAVGFTDIEPVKVGQPGIVIQWDEEWTPIMYSNPLTDELESNSSKWSGTRLTLPYNADTSESNKPDRAVVEYIGQSHPTSYFGTQLGTTASWSAEIEQTDTERIDLLRKLSVYQGNVYVRNSRGVGYWAVVEVSFTITHAAVLIPVSINITRVRGGV